MSNNSQPLLSIVTATYNSMKYFKETETNIRNLEIDNYEWIIVDDGSKDGTRDYLKSIASEKINVVLKPANKGIEDSYKTGIELARGKYLLILDHDDTVPIGTITKRISQLEQNPQSNLAFGKVAYMDEQSNVYRVSSFKSADQDTLLTSFKALMAIFLSPTYPLKQGCVILKTQFVKDHPGYYDIQLFLLAAKFGPVVFINQPCLNYRTFRSQFSSSRKMRVVRFFQFVWVKYAFQFLPLYLSPFLSVYKTGIELLKVVWSLVSSKRI